MIVNHREHSSALSELLKTLGELGSSVLFLLHVTPWLTSYHQIVYLEDPHTSFIEWI